MDNSRQIINNDDIKFHNIEKQSNNESNQMEYQVHYGAQNRRELFNLHEEALNFIQKQNNKHDTIICSPSERQVQNVLLSNNNQLIQDKLEPNQIKLINLQSKNNATLKQGEGHFMLFKQIGIIQKIKQALLNTLSLRNFSRLTQTHFNIIGDMVHYINAQDKSNTGTQSKYCRRFYKILGKIQNLPTFSPTNQVMLLYQGITMLFNFIYLYINPVRVSFEADFNISYILNNLGIIIFIIKMLMSFNTGFYDEGVIITNRKKIFRNLLPWQLLIDLITIASLITNNQLICLIIFIFRIPEIYKIFNNIDEHLQLNEKFYTVIELLKLAVLIFFLAHYVSCGFHLVSQNQENDISWIDKQNLTNSPWEKKYVNSLYFSFVLMLTIGFGDITPVTIKEKIFIIIIAQIGCGIFAYAINTIGSIFQERARKENNFKHMKFDIRNYMVNRCVSKQTQVKVIKQLEYTFNSEHQGQDPKKGEAVLNLLSKSIREEVYRDYFGKILINSKFFGSNFSFKFLNQLALQMHEMTLAPQEILFRKGDFDNRLFYISRGSLESFIELISNEKEVTFQSFQQGDFVGERGFFASFPRDISVRSKTISHLVYCTQEDFLQILKNNWNDYERYCMIKEEYLFNQNHVEKKCQLCQQYNHVTNQCNLIQYVPDKDLIIKRFNYSEDTMQRTQIHRQLKLKFKAYRDMKRVRRTIRKTRIYIIEDTEYDKIEEARAMLKVPEDKHFFLNTPQIKLVEGNVIIDSDNSYSSSDEDEDDSDEQEINNEGIQNQINHQISQTTVDKYQGSIVLDQQDENISQNSHKNPTITSYSHKVQQNSQVELFSQEKIGLLQQQKTNNTNQLSQQQQQSQQSIQPSSIVNQENAKENSNLEIAQPDTQEQLFYQKQQLNLTNQTSQSKRELSFHSVKELTNHSIKKKEEINSVEKPSKDSVISNHFSSLSADSAENKGEVNNKNIVLEQSQQHQPQPQFHHHQRNDNRQHSQFSQYSQKQPQIQQQQFQQQQIPEKLQQQQCPEKQPSIKTTSTKEKYIKEKQRKKKNETSIKVSKQNNKEHHNQSSIGNQSNQSQQKAVRHHTQQTHDPSMQHSSQIDKLSNNQNEGLRKKSQKITKKISQLKSLSSKHKKQTMMQIQNSVSPTSPFLSQASRALSEKLKEINELLQECNLGNDIFYNSNNNQESQDDMIEFDKMKDFKNFFPHNNFTFFWRKKDKKRSSKKRVKIIKARNSSPPPPQPQPQPQQDL